MTSTNDREPTAKQDRGHEAAIRRSIPEVWGEDDGERWTAEGHFDPLAMALGVLVMEMYLTSPAEATEALIASSLPGGPDSETDWLNAAEHLVGCVSHIYLRESDDDLDDRLYPCKPDEPSAQPYTLLEL